MAKCTHIFKGDQLKSKLSTPQPDRLQHDRPAACVIAQQYSSAIFVSLRFHSRNEKIRYAFRNYYYFNFSLILKLRKSENA
jgi:hypothetical protein